MLENICIALAQILWIIFDINQACLGLGQSEDAQGMLTFIYSYVHKNSSAHLKPIENER